MNEMLRLKWHDLLRALAVDTTPADRTFEDVRTHYAEPGRFYHTAVLHVVQRDESFTRHFGKETWKWSRARTSRRPKAPWAVRVILLFATWSKISLAHDAGFHASIATASKILAFGAGVTHHRGPIQRLVRRLTLANVAC
jgi:hypothetical protein